MPINFMSNSIQVGNTPTFADFVKKIQNQKAEQLKTASAVEPIVKTASVKTEIPAVTEPVKTVVAETKVTEVTKVAETKEEKKEKKEEKAEEKAEKKEDKKEECPCTKKEKKEEKKDCMASTETTKFVKVAKLDAKTKSFLKTYWGNLYPAEYVEAMLSDK